MYERVVICRMIFRFQVLIFAHANAAHSPRVKEPALRPREMEQAAVRQARGEKHARNSVWEVRTRLCGKYAVRAGPRIMFL